MPSKSDAIGVGQTTPQSGCSDCVGASAFVVVQPAPMCMDCDIYFASVRADHRDNTATFDASVCRASFFYLCVVDEHHQYVLL